MLVYTYGSGGWLPPAKPPVDQVSDCHTVMVPSFLPAILILPKALGRLPAICCSVARSRKILTGLPPAFWESRAPASAPAAGADLLAKPAPVESLLAFALAAGSFGVGARVPPQPVTNWVEGQDITWSPCHWITQPWGSRQQWVITGMPYTPSETASASCMAFSGSPVTFSPAALPREPALARSASLTKCGITSYSTLILRTASRATSSVVAATAATSWPCHWSSLPASAMTCTALTPSIFSAALVSMEVMRAWPCGQVRYTAYSMSFILRSEVYLARPAAFCGPSRRLKGLPMILRVSIGGQL